MAFLRAARPAGREWTVEEAAVYAARRDFELLKLLATDKRALRTARVLGMCRWDVGACSSRCSINKQHHQLMASIYASHPLS